MTAIFGILAGAEFAYSVFCLVQGDIPNRNIFIQQSSVSSVREYRNEVFPGR